MVTKLGHRAEQADIQTVIEILLSDGFSGRLGRIYFWLDHYGVSYHQECVRRVLQRMTDKGQIKRDTIGGNYVYSPIYEND